MFAFIKEHFDLQIGISTFLLSGIGAISIFSATYDAHAASYFYRQLFFIGIGTIGLLIFTFLPFRTLQSLSIPAYVASLALLVTVLLLGRTVSGSTSWFNFGAFRLQPSEFTKITTVLALASYLSRSDVSLESPRCLMTASAIMGAPVLLIMLQPDLGTAIIYLASFFMLLYWGGAMRFTLVSIVAPIAAAVGALLGTTPFLIVMSAAGVLIYITKRNLLIAAIVFSATVLVGISVQTIYQGLKPYQQKRIATFFNPNADPLGAGYNINQSKVAIGSGGLMGKGYLQGTQTQLNFIPEQWTDFIYCVPGEEFGFLGAATVLVLFGVLLMRGISLATSVKSRYAGFVVIGLTGILAAHTFINIGMALGMFPVIGVPLPFLSYGGSAMITNAAIVGILMNLYINRKEY
jgi:rod shape determining protein RodA